MEEILKNSGVKYFGFVPFGQLKLLDTRSRRRIPAGCRSRAAMIFPYYSSRTFGGNVSCYCAVPDYHRVLGEVLSSLCGQMREKYPGEEFVPFTDASPVAEVDMAVKAGLGVRGKNGLLINPECGSFVFIGEILTTLPCPTLPKGGNSLCPGCGRCERACPGGALSGGELDKARCASYISQKKGELTMEEKEILKKAGSAFGCDICQRVCPLNKNVPDGGNLFSRDIVNTVTEENAEELCAQRAFGFKGPRVIKRNLKILAGREQTKESETKAE